MLDYVPLVTEMWIEPQVGGAQGSTDSSHSSWPILTKGTALASFLPLKSSSLHLLGYVSCSAQRLYQLSFALFETNTTKKGQLNNKL